MLYMVNNETKEHKLAERNYTTVGGVGVKSIEPLIPGWRYVPADADGWIKWEGGECPLPSDVKCQWKSDNGFVNNSPVRAGEMMWVLGPRTITHYRPVLEDKPPVPHVEKGVDRESPRRPFIDSVRMWASYASPGEKQWGGEGLPPVGTVCEMTHKNANRYEGWEACTIIAYHEEWVVAALEGKAPTSKRVASWRFRPIRSEEDRAVDEMKAVAGLSYVKPEHMEIITRALYRAGYRKTNTNEEK